MTLKETGRKLVELGKNKKFKFFWNIRSPFVINSRNLSQFSPAVSRRTKRADMATEGQTLIDAHCPLWHNPEISLFPGDLLLLKVLVINMQGGHSVEMCAPTAHLLLKVIKFFCLSSK